MADAAASGDLPLLRELEADYAYDAVDTCAVDGMCQVACPVNINTGDLVKRLRAEDAGRISATAWRSAAGNWSAVTRAAAAGLNAAAALPFPLVTGATRAARRVMGADTVPLWTPDLPRGGHRRRPIDSEAPTAVYFPSCLGAMFAPTGAGLGVDAAFLALCERARVSVVSPRAISGLCCGTPWKSKGLTAGYERMRERTLSALRTATRSGTLPVVSDAASCTQGLMHLIEEPAATGAAESAPWQVVDVVEFVARHVLPSLTVRHKIATLTLHPTCSSVQLGIDDSLLEIAQAVADDVVIPDDWACCGFAGDRGMLHPELTASATRSEAAEVAKRSSAAFASCNRTCEIGMSRATGHNYEHIVELLEVATRDINAP
jgi:D-lactate dehydrogenase